jgi:hypothetical protein
MSDVIQELPNRSGTHRDHQQARQLHRALQVRLDVDGEFSLQASQSIGMAIVNNDWLSIITETKPGNQRGGYAASSKKDGSFHGSSAHA